MTNLVKHMNFHQRGEFGCSGKVTDLMHIFNQTGDDMPFFKS